MSLNRLNKLFEPLTSRNNILKYESEEERKNRIKKQFNLFHGKGKRKKKKKNRR